MRSGIDEASIQEVLRLPSGGAETLLLNRDMAPTPSRERTWGFWHFTSLWVGMSVCIPTYMLAAGMIRAGMTWFQSLAVIVAGNALVLIPLLINAHAGTRYGIPFPVLARAAYGVRGSHLPSLLRSLVACGWFGIQTWIGGTALNSLLGILSPVWRDVASSWHLMGQSGGEYAGFVLFWLLNMAFVWRGTESIRLLEVVAAPFLIFMGVALLLWASERAGGLAAILRGSQALSQGRQRTASWGSLTRFFLPWLTAMVGYWATLSLNIPDFTRYARSQKEQMLGQAAGLLTAMPLYAFIGIAVTSATLILYGEAIWNPVTLVDRLTRESHSPLLGVVAMLAVLLATLSTNIAANVVAPANAISNLAPRWISFRAGGIIAGLIAILLFPWKLLEMYQGWLISYSGLLGAVGGVLVADYVFVRGCRLQLRDLYCPGGEYDYQHGWHGKALVATGGGVAVALLGRLVVSLSFLFSGAWFSAGAVACGLYLVLMRGQQVGGGLD